ncbi:hypothetical protein COT52_00300 [candidate division WWE3 bacterium CG08_land_8_20_14_0_20_43_13]|uniref:D-alanyl-D-alanine carboxypeptidase-like core domain-containing protein n=1 Tax=candidate division WWE3 bacterium CG08_land_8_20_14_0_20_43_13 TaxID=1975087 RepID=A0A2H0X894_UNCKA|nr:MAG: hypothetical protein COT52_00300 [candidate division WWE3 bacterium CG08_land_8_20_14_0_20_43_13]
MEKEASAKMSRRDFLKASVKVAAGAVLTASGVGCSPLAKMLETKKQKGESIFPESGEPEKKPQENLPANFEIVRPISKDFPLPEGYIPEKLITLNSFPNIKLSPGKEKIQGQTEAVKSLDELFKAAGQAKIDDIYIGSAYRSWETQRYLYEQAEAKQSGQKWSAAPGTSEHNAGLAFDFTTESISHRIHSEAGFEDTPASRWLRENAHQYGFILTYCRPDIGGINQEPWHYRYVGKELSTELFNQGYLEADSNIDPINFLASHRDW